MITRAPTIPPQLHYVTLGDVASLLSMEEPSVQ